MQGLELPQWEGFDASSDPSSRQRWLSLQPLRSTKLRAQSEQSEKV